MDELNPSRANERRKRRITRRQALLLSLATPLASGAVVGSKRAEAALIHRIEKIRARLRARTEGEQRDRRQDQGERLTQWGNWPNWYNWGNWGGRVARRVGGWRWPGR